MNLPSYIVLAILILIIGLVLFILFKDRGHGKCCGCNNKVCSKCNNKKIEK